MMDSSKVDRIAYMMSDKLWDFDGKVDGILLSGHAVANIIAVSICYQLTDTVLVLIHRKNLGYYEVRPFDKRFFFAMTEAAAERHRDYILRDREEGPFDIAGMDHSPLAIPIDF